MAAGRGAFRRVSSRGLRAGRSSKEVMCTVTFWPSKGGYRLGMNRDEKHTRPGGLNPQLHSYECRLAVHPAELTGGTWITLNDAGVCLTLLNWYGVPQSPCSSPISRGQVIARSRWVNGPDDLDHALQTAASALFSQPGGLSLRATLPFRLVGFFPSQGEIWEWRWDQKSLTRQQCGWQPQQWISSGYDELGSQCSRGEVFRQFSRQPVAGSAEWFRQLHSSHDPQPGAYSTCVHRSDAATVSYTEVEITMDAGTGVMRHVNGSPCCGTMSDPITVPLLRARPPRRSYPSNSPIARAPPGARF